MESILFMVEERIHTSQSMRSMIVNGIVECITYTPVCWSKSFHRFDSNFVARKPWTKICKQIFLFCIETLSKMLSSLYIFIDMNAPSYFQFIFIHFCLLNIEHSLINSKPKKIIDKLSSIKSFEITLIWLECVAYFKIEKNHHNFKLISFNKNGQNRSSQVFIITELLLCYSI